MSNIVPSSNTFHYQKTTDYPLRTIMQDGEPWFVAADVCEALGLGNVSMAVNGNEKTGNVGLDEDEKNTIMIHDGIPGNPNKIIVSLPGLYKLIFRSNKPEAKAFTRWVTHEVLPSIMNTGSYSIVTNDSNNPKLLQPTSPRYNLSEEDEETLILRYVERLGNPTARQMGQYLKRYQVNELRFQLHHLAEQGKLKEQLIRTNSHRYTVK